MDHSRPLFFFVIVFSIQLTVNVQYNYLPMTRFEPRTSRSKATALPTEPQPLLEREQMLEMTSIFIVTSNVVKAAANGIIIQ